jgi:cell division septal protein FtsQ
MKTLQSHHLKARQNQKKKRVVLYCFLGLLLLIILLGYLVLFSSVFKIKSVEVTSTKILDSIIIQQEVQRILDQGRAWGPLVIKNNIFFIPANQINDYLKGIPVIESFSCTEGFFTKRLKINIQEREAIGVLKQTVGEDYYFDKNGNLFIEAPDSEGAIIIGVENNSSHQFNIGNRILERESFRDLMNIVKLLDDNFLSNRVELKDDKIEIVAKINDDKEVSFYFDSNDLNRSYSVLSHFIQNNFNFDLEYLDLRYLPNIYYK